MSAIAAARRLAAHAARIRYRLLLVNVLVAAVPLVGIGFAELHEAQLLAGLERDMIHQVQLVRAFVGADGRPLSAHEPILRTAARETRTRIRIVDAGGGVVADSHRHGPPEGAEPPAPRVLGAAEPRVAQVPKIVPVAERREIRAALAGRYGAATRLWDSEGRVYLFSALPVERAGRVVGAVYATRSTHDVQVQLYRLRTWLFRLLAATLLVTTLISLLLATTIAHPLDKLTRRAQRIAARQPVTDDDALASRADEIGQLARAVDAMTEELERRAHDARTLAADISHELKTPLAGIRGAAELLRDGAADDVEVRDRFLTMIVDDAARIDRDLSRLLELARAEDDRGARELVDVAALARACAARPWPRAVEVCGGDGVLYGRPPQLASAIENLVANAMQHADEGTAVRLRVERESDLVRVTVENHGPALSAAAQRKVWDRFYTTRTGAGGTGLGLAIVRSVALAHGGSVGVRCAGGITAFWLEVRAAMIGPCGTR